MKSELAESGAEVDLKATGLAGRAHAERWLAAIVESSDDAILGKSLQGIITSWNAGATRIFGYEAEEAIGKPISFLAWPGEEERIEMFLERLRRGERVDHFEVARKHKTGRKIIVSLSLSPIVDSSGTIIGIAKIARDITRQKEAEEALAAQEASLRQMRELEARQKEAERLNQMKSEFMASVSHELRTPLHTIIGFAELLGEESHGSLSEQQRRFLEHIQQDSEHLLGLINDVLDLSRIEARGLNLQTQKVALGPMLLEAIEAMRPYAESRGVSLKARGSLDFRVTADPMRLRQILSNLLNNGAKFTSSGGEVSVAAERHDDMVRVTVADTGVGIAPEERRRIFEKFYQVGLTPTGVREGTGLGLAICKQLVEMQGGRIWVEGGPKRGSQFHFTLPESEL